MPLIALALGIVILFVLVIVFKLNAFLSLIISAIIVGLFQGMDPLAIVTSIETGLGGTLGHLAIIIGLGAIFGKIISEGGGANRIASTLIQMFGQKKVDWAICIASFLMGIILFYEVSYILIIPIVYTVAVEAKVKLMKVGIPFLAAISITHVFLPPHPGPTAISAALRANLGVVLGYGFILAIPATYIFGILFAKLYKNWDIEIPNHLVSKKEFNMNEVPSFATSVLTTLLPVILILIGVIADFSLPENSVLTKILTFIGNADMALLISLLIAVYVFGLHKKRKTMSQLMKTVEAALVSMGGIIFILGGGGAFKQVILDSGMAEYIADFTSGWSISPFVLAWIIALIIRLAVGSATVTVLTTAGIMLPIVEATGVNPELMVLAIGSASIAWAPPSDVSFWMTKEYFNLTVGQTIKSVSFMYTLVAIYGILGVLVLNMFIG
ncbi:gluconate:H+ symporter [Robertmurraya kyonggiensis]|uniref:TRAP transporter large permease subunit n=1 Tax=Robertmurraya kyonggiensis TaxID=1037680 RepID=A0A4U1D962_9BACI|nr:gluconate:H+ symporter [Robertmurraya kyonggiensis]TKC19085.1 TRAP transporter large permease subunit [Robertmurraya kyonggiensis]